MLINVGAVSEFDAGFRAPLDRAEAERWARELRETYTSHPIFFHPHLQHLGSGAYPDNAFAVKDHAQQVFAFGRDFRAYLGLTLSKLKDCVAVRDNLLQHLREENGIYTDEEIRLIEQQGIPRSYFDGSPHMVLYAELLEKVGVSRSEFIPEADRLNRWMIDTLRACSSTVGVVMILGIELWAMTASDDILPALRRAGVSSQDAIFFDLHQVVDTNLHVGEIGDDIVQILSSQPPENTLEELKQKACEFSDVRVQLWDALHRRALDRSVVTAPPLQPPQPTATA